MIGDSVVCRAKETNELRDSIDTFFLFFFSKKVELLTKKKKKNVVTTRFE